MRTETFIAAIALCSALLIAGDLSPSRIPHNAHEQRKQADPGRLPDDYSSELTGCHNSILLPSGSYIQAKRP